LNNTGADPHWFPKFYGNQLDASELHRNPGKGLKECLNPKNFPGRMALDPFLEEWAFGALFRYWSPFILDPQL